MEADAAIALNCRSIQTRTRARARTDWRRTMTDDALLALDASWRAANSLTVGQIYLRDNALLREPLRPEHIKPRLLGHWGTSPGLSLLYAHMNRLIRKRNLDAIFLAGPGDGGPALIANVWLGGAWAEIYPGGGPGLGGVDRA